MKKSKYNNEIYKELYSDKLYQELLEQYKNPKDPEVMYYVGMANLCLGKYKEANAILETAEQELKYRFEDHELLEFVRESCGEALKRIGIGLQENNPQQALEWLEKAYEKFKLLKGRQKKAELCLDIAKICEKIFYSSESVESCKFIKKAKTYREEAERELTTGTKSIAEIVKRNYEFKENKRRVRRLITIGGGKNLSHADKLCDELLKRDRKDRVFLALKAIVNAKLGIILENKDSEQAEKRYLIAHRFFKQADANYIGMFDKRDYHECLGYTIKYLYETLIKNEAEGKKELKQGIIAFDWVLRNIYPKTDKAVEKARNKILQMFISSHFSKKTKETAETFTNIIMGNFNELGVNARLIGGENSSIFDFLNILIEEFNRIPTDRSEEKYKELSIAQEAKDRFDNVKESNQILLIPKESPYIIPSNKVKLVAKLGSGAYGEVYSGTLQTSKKDSEVDVAVKVCNGTPDDEALKIMGRRYPGMVKVLGLVIKAPRLEILDIKKGDLIAKKREIEKYVEDKSRFYLIRVNEKGKDPETYLYAKRSGYGEIIDNKIELLGENTSNKEKEKVMKLLSGRFAKIKKNKSYLWNYIGTQLGYEMKYQIVMECAESDLRKHLQERENCITPWLEKVRMIREGLEAIASLHKQKVLHRDVKAENILLDKNNRVLLTDFGFSMRLTEHAKEESKESKQDHKKVTRVPTFNYNLTLKKKVDPDWNNIVGSPPYLPPEVWSKKNKSEKWGEDKWSTGSDIYSFSLVIWEILCGYAPYRTLYQKLCYDREIGMVTYNNVQHAVKDFGVREIIPPIWPHKLQKLVMSMWKKYPTSRLKNTKEALKIVNEVFEEINELQTAVKRLLDSKDSRQNKIKWLKELLKDETWLSMRKLKNGQLEILLEALQGNNALEGLDLSDNEFSASAFKILAEIIKDSKHLRGIALNGINLHGDGMKTIAAAIKVADPKLHYFEFRSCKLTKEDIVGDNGLAKQCKSEWLATINLNHNGKLDKECFSELAKLYKNDNGLIVDLMINHESKLEKNGVKEFRRVFHKNLREYFLSKNVSENIAKFFQTVLHLDFSGHKHEPKFLGFVKRCCNAFKVIYGPLVAHIFLSSCPEKNYSKVKEYSLEAYKEECQESSISDITI